MLEYMKLADIAEIAVASIERGSPDLEIKSPAGLDLAKDGEITFLANPKYTPQVAKTKASAIFLSEGVEIGRDDIAVLRTKDAYVAYTLALRAFFPEAELKHYIHRTAVIDESAEVSEYVEIHPNVVVAANCHISDNVRIMPNVTIYEGVSIGPNTTIHSGVSIRENCEVGARCIIHNNTTIGSDGFGYAKTEDKSWLKIPQAGRVVLEDDVEIGANTAIDCASVGETRIKRGTKIDNLVQIGHSCTIDEDSLICAQTGLAGSSHIGKRVLLTGQVGIEGHLKIGDDVVMTAKSAVSHDVEPGKVLSGVPAFDNRDWLRSTAAFRRLGEFAQRLRKLEKKVFGSEPPA
jgi:UDP-3-O-[3-hydroxymyristoyl] glucosamine N-acyltransferase